MAMPTPPQLRMRTLLLVPLLLMPVLLTCASLLVLRHQMWVQMQHALDADMQYSSATFRNLEEARRALLRHEGLLLADQPSLKALMTTQDAKTIANEAGDYSRLSGSDLFGLAEPSGNVVVLLRRGEPAASTAASAQIRGLLTAPSPYIFTDHSLYEVTMEPIYFGASERGTLLGYVVLGAAVDREVARQVSQSTSGEVAFSVGNEVVSSTLPMQAERDLAGHLTKPSDGRRDQVLDKTQYLLTRLHLADQNQLPIRLILLKSLSGLHQEQSRLNRTLLAIGVGAFVIGAILATGLARLLTSTLERLVTAVRGVGAGDYEQNLPDAGPQEVMELSMAIAAMRGQIRKAQADLLESERLATIGQMASSISHDLRHYLASVYANAEFLATGRLPAQERADLLKDIQLAVQGTTDLIDSLLLFSRTGIAITLSHESLAYVAERAVAMLRGHPEAVGVNLSLSVFSDAETSMDGKKIERVIYNLILNGCQSARNAEGNRQVSVEVTESESQVQVRVADSGGGIPSEIRHRLFEPFISANKENGVGIGLTLASAVAAEHGGSVLLESTEPGRTVFVLTLPRITGVAATQPIPVTVGGPSRR